MMLATPVLQIRRSDHGQEISVAAAWPDGRIKTVGGFKTEAEANEWITRKFQEWMEEQGA
jgi:hypothetical protein